MATDIFGRKELVSGESFAPEDALITFNSSAGDIGLVLTAFQFAYQQQTSRVYSLTQRKVHFVQGPPNGSGQFDGVAGPVKLSASFIKHYGSVCDMAEKVLNVSFNSGCARGETSGRVDPPYKYTYTGVLINAISGNVQSEQMLFQHALGFEFVALSIPAESTANPAN